MPKWFIKYFNYLINSKFKGHVTFHFADEGLSDHVEESQKKKHLKKIFK